MWKWALVALSIGLMAGCNDQADGQSSSDASVADVTSPAATVDENGQDPASPVAPESPSSELTRYTLANRCFAVKSVATNQWVTRGDTGDYQASAASAAQATGFYFKPSDLGKYMLYADNQTLVDVAGDDPTGLTTGISGFHLGSIDAPADHPSWKVNHGVLWEIKKDDKGFYLTSQEHDPQNGEHMLAVADDGSLQVADRKTEDNADQRFTVEPTMNCADFPEISTDTIGKTYKGQGVEQPVVGFADIHSHISASGFLGGAHAGRPFSKYGVALALPKGRKQHGFTGFFDLIGNIYGGNPLDLHDTQGWPTFNDWPAYDRLLYESTYYRWIDRSHKAGLRLVVNNLVQNDVLCSLNNVLQTANPGDPDLIRKVKNALSGVHGLTSIPNGLLDGLIDQALNGSLSEVVGDSCNA